MNEQKQPLKKCSAKIGILQYSCSKEYQAECMTKIFEKKTVKKFNFVKLQI